MANHVLKVGTSPSMGSAEKLPIAKIVIIFVAAFLLQVIVAPNISISNVAPNFLFVAALIIASFSTPRAGVVVGFLFGLVFDLLSTGPVGAMALLLSISCFLYPKITESMSIENIGGWIIAVAIFALATSLIYAIIMLIISGASFFASLLHIVLPWTVYNTAIGLLGWPLVPHGSKSKSSSKMNTRIKL